MDQNAQALIDKLRNNPGDVEAYESLKALYQRKREFASLANLVEGWAKRLQGQSAAAETFAEAAQIVASCLGDSDRAINLYRRALQHEGLCENAWRGLQYIYEQRRDFRRLYEVLEQHDSVAQQVGMAPADRADIQQRLGLVAHSSLQRVDLAIHHYRTASQLDPHAVAPIFALRELHYAAGDFAEVATLYGKEARLETDPQRRHSLWVELSNLRLHRLGDLPGAIEALRTARSQAPRDTQTLHSLATLILQQSELEQDSTARASLRGEAAEALYELAQQVGGEHIVTYCEAALDAAPAHEAALARLEQILSVEQPSRLHTRWSAYIGASQNRDGVRRRRLLLGASYRDANLLKDCAECLEPLLADGDAGAAEALVDVYASLGRPQDVVRALDICITGATSPASASLHESLLNALIQIGAEERAFSTAQTILENEPNHNKALSYLKHVCRARGEYHLLVNALLNAANSDRTPISERVEHLEKIVTISQQQLNDDAITLSAYKQIMQLLPNDDEPARQYAQALEERSHWDELATVIQRRLQLNPSSERELALLRQLVEVQHHHRQDNPQAIQALRQIYRLAPQDNQVRDLLCELLLEAGAAVEATPLMRQRVAEPSPEDNRIELMRRLAEVLAEQVGDDEGAYEIYAELLDAGEAPEPLLENMIEIDTRLEEWERLVNTLSFRADLATTENRPSWVLRMADVCLSHLSDQPRASALLDQVLDVSPGHEGALDALTQMHIDAGSLRELVTVLKRRASDESLLSWRPDYYRRIARTLAKHVGNVDAAEEAWRKVLEDREDEEALRFLRTRADQQMALTSLVELNARLAPLVSSADEARDLLVERALVLRDAMEQPKEALNQLLSLAEATDEVDTEIWEALADTYIALEDYASAGERLRSRLESAPSEGDAGGAAARLANIADEHLDDPPLLIFALRCWCDSEPSNRDAHRRLSEELIATKDFTGAVTSLDQLAALEIDDANKGATQLRAAKLILNEIGDEDDAWQRLKDLTSANFEEAEAVLRDFSASKGKTDQLIEFFIELARTSADPVLQRERWLDVAGLYELELDDLPRSLEAALRALAADLENPATLEEVDRLAVATSAWPRLSQVYQKLIGNTTDSDKQAAYLLRQARLISEHGGSTGTALDLAARGWLLAPSLGANLQFVDELSHASQEPEKAIPVFERALLLCSDDTKETVRILLRCVTAEVHSSRGPTPPTRFLTRVIEACAGKASLLDDVEQVIAGLHKDHESTFSPTLVHALANLLIGQAEGEDEEAGGSLFIRAANLLSEHVEDHSTTLNVWKAATALWPDSDELLDQMETYTEHQSILHEFTSHLARLVDETVESSIAVRLLDRWGRVLESGLEDYEGAIEVYQRLLLLTPNDTELTRRLRSCLEQQGRHQEVLGILRHELDRRTLARERRQLLREIAMLWEHDLNNRWEALDAWKALLAEDPENEEASEALSRLERHSSPGAMESPSLDGLLTTESASEIELSDVHEAEESFTEFNGIDSEIFGREDTKIPELPTASTADLFAQPGDVSPTDDTALVGAVPESPLSESYTEINPFEESSILGLELASVASGEHDSRDGDWEEQMGFDSDHTKDERAPRARPPNVETVIPEMKTSQGESEIVDLGSDLFSLEESLPSVELIELEAEEDDEDDEEGDTTFGEHISSAEDKE